MARWLRWVVACFATGFAFVLILWIAEETLESLSWSAADKFAVEIGFATMMATGVLTSVAWWAGQTADLDNESASQDASKSRLTTLDSLAAVIQRENQMLLRALTSSGALPVTWSRHDLVSARAKQNAARGNVPQLARLFKRLRQQQLIIIGNPGSGKTTMAIGVILELIGQRKTPHDPVPIRFALSSWNPRSESLRAWLARALIEEYPQVCKAIFQGGQGGTVIGIEDAVIPVFDGLDEIDKISRRDAAVEALRKEMGADRPLIITSRSEEFEKLRHAPNVLPGATIVSMQPLSIPQVHKHFVETAPQRQRAFWESVFKESNIRHHASLRNTLTNPLMVWLAGVLVSSDRYDGTSGIDWLSSSKGEVIEAHLLEALVPASFDGSVRGYEGNGGPLTASDPEEAERWLVFLAGRLRQRHLKDIQWWRIPELIPQGTLTLVAACITGALIGWMSGGSMVLSLWFSLSAWSGCFFGFGIGHGYSTARSGKATLRGRMAFGGHAAGSDVDASTLLRRLCFGSCASAVMAASALLVIAGTRWIGGRALGALFAVKTAAGGVLALSLIAIICCLLSGEAIGRISGLVMQSSDALDRILAGARAGGPTDSVRKDRYAALRTAVAGAAVCSSFCYVILRSTADHQIALSIGSGVFAGASSSLVFTPWPRFRAASAWLAITGKLPWRLMAFLDEACEYGVLRRIGIVFEFRHDLLQRSLAARDGPAPESLRQSDSEFTSTRPSGR